MPYDPGILVLIFFISIVGGMLQGSLGFGLGPFSVPLLLLIDSHFIPGPLLLVSIFLTSSVFYRERHEVHKMGFSWALVGRFIGSVFGAWLLVIIPVDKLNLLYGGLILLAVLLSFSGWKLPLVPKNLVFAGTLSGMMATAAAIGGPPMAMVYQHGSGGRLRSTLSAIFIVGAFISMGALLFVGKMGLADVWHAALLFPGIMIGFYLSRFTVKILDKRYMRPAILFVSTVSAAVLIINNI